MSASIHTRDPKCEEFFPGQIFAGRALSVCSAMTQSTAADQLTAVGWAPHSAWTGEVACREAERRLERLTGPGQSILRDPHLDDDWLLENVICRPAEAVVGPLLGGDLAIENVFAVQKHPDQHFEVPWHQDGINAELELDPRLSVAVWIAITDATVENGCIEVAPGSHRLGYQRIAVSDEVQDGAGRPTIATELECVDEIAKVALSSGDACLMDPRLLHRSGTNRSDSARIGMNVRFVAPGGIRRLANPGKRLFSIRERESVEAGGFVKSVIG